MSSFSEKKAAAFNVIERLAQWYEECLTGDSRASVDAYQYLLGRNFSEATISEFRIGYAPKDFTFNASDDELKLLAELGYIDWQDNHWHHNYEGRVMFPIMDVLGRVRGFSGRRVGNAPTIKYYNSAETFFFRKSELLFGFPQARRRIFVNNKAIICEGFTDVMAFHQVGSGVAVACMGTSLTKHHMGQLLRYTDNLYLAFDADAGGNAALRKSIDLAKTYGMNYAVQKFPDGKDPAECLLGA